MFKKNNYIFLILALATTYLANAQEVRVIDNKGTIRTIFTPTVSETHPASIQSVAEAATYTTINLDAEDFTPNVADYTNEIDGIVVLKAGRYKITYRITSEVVNNTRVGGEFQLTRNGNAIANTKSFSYQRNNLVDKNTVTVVKIINLDINDKIGIEGRVYDSNRGPSDSLRIIPEGTMLIIEKLD